MNGNGTAATRFVLNGALHEAAAPPATTLLDHLRDQAGLTAAKEGCAEGDCGACTVVRVVPGETGPRHEAVNACLMQIGQADGTEILTVEGIAAANGGRAAPVQLAMAEGGGTQCGFCTPGFVAALVALGHGGETLTDDVIHEALAGNLCRCTGYRPIVAAARRTGRFHEPRTPPAPTPEQRFGGEAFLAPESLSTLLALRAEHPGAMLLAGGTDLGLSVSKTRERPRRVLHVARVRELRGVARVGGALVVGAAATYAEALPAIEELHPSFGRLLRRLGSRQIRNLGTIGGNVGNASPIGDTLPCLIALDAVLALSSSEGEREMPAEEFFLGYRRTALGPGEVIRAVRIPEPGPGEEFRVYKVSKRHDQDISTVIGAFRLSLDGRRVSGARIAYGGMAAVPARARAAEEALRGAVWSEEAARRAGEALAEDFDPIGDHRGSADYRRRVAANLPVRLWRDLAGKGPEAGLLALRAGEEGP